jgi:5-methylcytosine-specific restriction protein A
MPFAAPRWCPRCGVSHPSGSECPVGAAERRAEVDRSRPSARHRGYDRRWEAARAAYLQAHPLCVVCGQQATEVDHAIPIALGGAMWDEANWQALCKPHHSAKTMREVNERRAPHHG